MLNPVHVKATLPVVTRALVVCAHPDDLELWCGGTLALLVERGAEVRLLVCTKGEKGSTAPRVTPEQVAAFRMQEQRAAAARLGIRAVRFLDEHDGEVEVTNALRGALVRVLREFRPEVVFTHDPEYPYPPYTAHRDHRSVGRAVLDAAHPAAGGRLYFPKQIAEGLSPHHVSHVWLFASTIASTAIDISSTLERKIVARLEHRSQTTDADELRIAWRDRAAEVGAPFGLPSAEAFTVLDL